MEAKHSNWTTVNIMARRKLKRETEKAVLFSIPKHKGLSVWISKKCIHGSRSGKSLAVGIKAGDEYIIWLYDNDAKIHVKNEIWQGQFIVHPNDLKTLKVGECYLKTTLPSGKLFIKKILVDPNCLEGLIQHLNK